jgi:hypothetical protein
VSFPQLFPQIGQVVVKVPLQYGRCTQQASKHGTTETAAYNILPYKRENHNSDDVNQTKNERPEDYQ